MNRVKVKVIDIDQQEEGTHPVVQPDGTIQFVPVAQYVASVLRAIDTTLEGDKRTEPVLNEGTIRYHFQQFKESHTRVGAETTGIEEIEKDVLRWYKIDNPIQKLTEDLRYARCSPMTIRGYEAAARRYMRFVGYEPEFTPSELNGFLNALGAVSTKTLSFYTTILRCWWDSMGLLWPIRNRRIHTPHTDVIEEAATYTTREITQLVNLAREYGTPEIKYYLCLAVVFAPRRIELGAITQENFTWNGRTGTLQFVPHKHGLIRTHHIPAELTPYLRHYDATPIPHWAMTRKFTQYCREIGFQPLKHKQGKKASWHAFRHSLTTALIENGVDSVLTNRWMGWRSGSRNAPMVSVYYSPEKLDERVQERHPYIPMWK